MHRPGTYAPVSSAGNVDSEYRMLYSILILFSAFTALIQAVPRPLHTRGMLLSSQSWQFAMLRVFQVFRKTSCRRLNSGFSMLLHPTVTTTMPPSPFTKSPAGLATALRLRRLAPQSFLTSPSQFDTPSDGNNGN